MKIIKHPVRIRGEDYTVEVRFSQSEYDMVQIQVGLYRGVRKIYQKPEFTFRKRIPVETYIREAEHEMKLMEGAHGG